MIPGLSYSDEQLFQLVNVVLPAWLLLLVAPKYGVPLSTWVAAFCSVLYVATVAGSILVSGEGNVMADMMTFEGVAKLLSTRSVVLPAWMHYAAFDLWVGRWEVVDARSRGVPQVLMALPVGLTMFFGPAGLLLYLAAIRPWFRATGTSGTLASKED